MPDCFNLRSSIYNSSSINITFNSFCLVRMPISVCSFLNFCHMALVQGVSSKGEEEYVPFFCVCGNTGSTCCSSPGQGRHCPGSTAFCGICMVILKQKAAVMSSRHVMHLAFKQQPLLSCNLSWLPV